MVRCSRHRGLELSLASLASALADCLAAPLQARLDTWRKKTSHADRDHAKQFKVPAGNKMIILN